MKKGHGDLTKLRYAMGLTAAEKQLLKNIEHVSRTIPGTMEVRKILRFETHAGRIRRGVPFFVTFSPDEKHNMVVLRLARSRASDPCHCADATSQPFGSTHLPDLER